MRVRDIMHEFPCTIAVDTTIADAAEALIQGDCEALPVVDEDGKLVGIVSERDLLINLTPDQVAVKPYLQTLLLNTKRWLPYYREFLKIHGEEVKSIMTAEVVTVGEDDPVEKAAELLIAHDVRQLPVVRDGKPVGMVDRYDVIKAFAP